MTELRVEICHAGVVQASHRVSFAAVDPAGKLRALAGDPDLVAVARSSIKPLQALPLIRAGGIAAFSLSTNELAICCSGHNGEPWQTSVVESILTKVGVDEAALACGPHAPMYAPEAERLARRGEPPRRLHNNCSGKHAGMLALARLQGWPLNAYHHANHPVQMGVLSEISAWTGVEESRVPIAKDGCGIPTFALPVSTWATAFAKLARAAHRGDQAPRAVADAMVQAPEYIAGTARFATELLRVGAGRFFAKEGAEGIFAVASPAAQLGIFLKAEDGAKRASEPALVTVLHYLGLLDFEQAMLLQPQIEFDVQFRGNGITGVIKCHNQVADAVPI